MKPQTTERARFAKAGFAYTPSKTREYKKQLSSLLAQHLLALPALREDIRKVYDQPVSITASFYMPIPKSLTRKNSEPWRAQLPTGRPDTDNLIKGVKDVLTGVVFKDDSQVTHEIVRKVYDLNPRIEITVQPSSPEFLKSLFE